MLERRKKFLIQLKWEWDIEEACTRQDEIGPRPMEVV